MTFLLSLVVVLSPLDSTAIVQRAPILTPVGMETLVDSMNTMMDNGDLMRAVCMVKVEHLPMDQDFTMHFPSIPGIDKRELAFLEWDPMVRRWAKVPGVRLMWSTERESGSMKVELSGGSGLFGLFVPLPRAPSLQHFTFELPVEDPDAIPEWRLSLVRSNVVIEGRGDVSLPLHALPPDALLSVTWHTVFGDELDQRTLWEWCGHSNRDLVRGACHYSISRVPQSPGLIRNLISFLTPSFQTP